MALGFVWLWLNRNKTGGLGWWFGVGGKAFFFAFLFYINIKNSENNEFNNI